MPRTVRVYWSQTVSRWHNFNWPAFNITAKSVVLISASEGQLFEGGFDPLNAIFHTRGDAVISVKNINPHDGGVEFYLEVNWDSPLNVCLDIMVFDPPEHAFVAGG
jgi:hypothetical protein